MNADKKNDEEIAVEDYDPYKEDETRLLVEFAYPPGAKPVGVLDYFRSKEQRDSLERKSTSALDKAMITIRNVAQKVNSSISEMGPRNNIPDHVELDFGIKFDAEVGVIIAKASMEASLNVKLVWDR